MTEPLSEITDRYRLLHWLVETGRTGSWAEIGVAQGNHARQMLRTGGFSSLYLIDTWEDDPYWMEMTGQEKYESCLEILRNCPDPPCTMIRKTSVDAAKLFDDQSLDFAFIDADHSYASAREDIAAWYPKVRDGGVIAGHDYTDWETMGVIQAVDEFVEAENLSLHVIPPAPNDNEVWVAVKEPKQ